MAPQSKKDKAEKAPKTPPRKFKVKDPKEGTFTLWDSIYETHREWKLLDSAKPGITMLMDKVEQEGREIAAKLPKDSAREKLAEMTDEERADIVSRVQKNSHKQLMIMASYCEPMFPLPTMLENKAEALAACLTDEKDAAKITAFFLIRSATSTTLLGDLKKEINQVLAGF